MFYSRTSRRNRGSWAAHLAGIRASLQPGNYHEEQIVYHIALAYWQAIRLCKYETAALRAQIENYPSYNDDWDQLDEVLSRGVDSLKAAMSEARKVIELLEMFEGVQTSDPLCSDDGRLLLRHALTFATGGKCTDERKGFSSLPEEG
jgi:hypothetical protein